MADLRRVCVFTGSTTGRRPQYAAAARELGSELAARGLELVYGGANVGLMGMVADAALAAGGTALGVLPRPLFGVERVHTGLTRLYEVGSMHERKALMFELADAFIALPGGYGTFDELFESITWAQIGLHAKPIGLLDVADYFAPLRALVGRAVDEGFVPAVNAGLLLTAATPVALLDQLAAFTPPAPGTVPLPGDESAR